MRILTIGDPHFKVDNLIETEEMSKKVLKLAQFEQPDFIVVLGDTLDRHENIHVAPLTLAIEWLYQLTQVSPVYLLIGNHDRPNNSDFLSNKHPFNALKQWSQITVIDTVVDIVLQDYRFIFVPYVPPGRFKEALDTLPQSIQGTTAIFAHQEFKGVKMGSIESKNGDIWFSDYPLVISGHIHGYSRLSSNIIYTGTAYQTSFGDNDRKTVSIFAWNSPTQTPEETRVELDLMRKETLTLMTNEVFNWTPPDLTRIRLKLKIKGTTDEIKAVMKLKKLKLWTKQPYNIKIIYQTVTNTEQIGKLVTSETSKMNYLELLKQVVGNLGDQHIVDWFATIFAI